VPVKANLGISYAGDLMLHECCVYPELKPKPLQATPTSTPRRSRSFSRGAATGITPQLTVCWCGCTADRHGRAKNIVPAPFKCSNPAPKAGKALGSQYVSHPPPHASHTLRIFGLFGGISYLPPGNPQIQDSPRSKITTTGVSVLLMFAVPDVSPCLRCSQRTF
jgi:hypothetical protein